VPGAGPEAAQSYSREILNCVPKRHLSEKKVNSDSHIPKVSTSYGELSHMNKKPYQAESGNI